MDSAVSTDATTSKAGIASPRDSMVPNDLVALIGSDTPTDWFTSPMDSDTPMDSAVSTDAAISVTSIASSPNRHAAHASPTVGATAARAVTPSDARADSTCVSSAASLARRVAWP